MQKDSIELPQWLIENNQDRTDKYARNLSDEKFLRYLNSVLEPYESAYPVKELEPYPIIFFFGLPRCGKTFFSQMLVHALDLGYPDNISARFWDAPTHGIHLSKILLKNHDIRVGFSSDYGKTSSLAEPHDFAYFWHKWLLITKFPYNYDAARYHIDWNSHRVCLSRMSQEWRKCSVFKGVNPSYHLSKIAQTYQKSLFIYIQRAPIDVAVSLRKGRLDNYGNLNKWYGQTPHPDIYHDLIKRPYSEQIAGQIKHLNELYESELEKIPAEKVLRISYKDFCKNPNNVISNVQRLIDSLYNYKINFKCAINDDFVKFSSHSSKLPFYEELLKALQAYSL